MTPLMATFDCLCLRVQPNRSATPSGLIKEESKLAAREAIARAVPMQRQATQSHIDELLAAERSRLEIASREALRMQSERLQVR